MRNSVDSITFLCNSILTYLLCFMFKIEEEIKECLDFLKSVYAVFGFTFQLHLSTRPDNYLGDLEIWDHAEKVINLKANKQTP